MIDKLMSQPLKQIDNLAQPAAVAFKGAAEAKISDEEPPKDTFDKMSTKAANDEEITDKTTPDINNDTPPVAANDELTDENTVETKAESEAPVQTGFWAKFKDFVGKAANTLQGAAETAKTVADTASSLKSSVGDTAGVLGIKKKAA